MRVAHWVPRRLAQPVGGVLLYGAFVVHPLLALWAVFQRRYLRRSPGNGLRLTLGLLVPPLLPAHVVSTRVAAT